MAETEGPPKKQRLDELANMIHTRLRSYQAGDISRLFTQRTILSNASPEDNTRIVGYQFSHMTATAQNAPPPLEEDLLEQLYALREDAPFTQEALNALSIELSVYEKLASPGRLPSYPLFVHERELIRIKELKLKYGAEYTPHPQYDALSKTILPVGELVNGYAVPAIFDIEWTLYLRFKKKSQQAPLNDAQFIEWFEEHACTDWGKMQRDGTPFGGFWDIDDGSKAYDLTKADNLRGLLELPYPRRLMKTAINYGCSTRLECVQFVGLICEFVTRMTVALAAQQN